MARVKRGYWYDLPEIKHGLRGNDDYREMWGSRLFGNIDKSDYYRMVGGVIKWDDTMARKTYRIELKIDFNDDSRHEALLVVAKQYARDFLASAMLLQDGRKPSAVLLTDDTFTGVEEIGIMEPSDGIHDPNNPGS